MYFLQSVSGKDANVNELMSRLNLTNVDFIKRNTFTALPAMLLSPKLDVVQQNCTAPQHSTDVDFHLQSLLLASKFFFSLVRTVKTVENLKLFHVSILDSELHSRLRLSGQETSK